MKQMMMLSCVAMAFVAFDVSAVYVIGAGVSSCGTWLSERREGNKVQYFQMTSWVAGYLRGTVDGMNITVDPLGALTSDKPADAIEAWLDKYCADHPLDTIYVAAGKLAHELLGRAVGLELQRRTK